jgi:Vacuolar protein sorting-associated protein 62
MRTRLAVLALGVGLAAIAASPAAAEDLSPEALLPRYQPVTVLDSAELFAPTSVDDFLADASLKQLGADGSFQPAEMPAAGLPVHGEGWRLDHRCAAVAGPLSTVQCYDPASQGASVVYGRYVVVAGTIVLQYWLFYEHNFWSLPALPFGAVWQAHEGDWEVVHVVLDNQRNPMEAAYSQHCTGQRRAWSDVPRVPGTSHPIVYVGRGSHANYFTPGLHPIARSCVPPPALAFFDALGVAPFDVVVPGIALGPATTAVERVHDNEPRWLRFPGTWGEAQYVAAPPFGIPPTAFGTSPVGPAFQDDWLDPLGTIAGYPMG